MFDSLFAVLFPDPCAVCEKPAGKNRAFCKRCETSPIYIGRNSVCKTCLHPIPSSQKLCGGCIVNPPPYDALISCVWFGGAIKKSLHRYKFRGRSDLHSSFSKIMISRLEEDGFCYDAVVPVPLSAERLKERGYNQSALLAKDIARHFQAPYYDTILIRKKHTLPQTTLPHKLRKENLRGAFALKNPEPLLKKRVLLIDDIFTTGATVREASKALSKAADSIAVCTIAASAYGKNITFPEDS